VQLVLGDSGGNRRLPDNDLVEAQLRRYLRTFGGAEHASLLVERRTIALSLMDYLAPYNPYLVGAVLNGTATEHSDIHLHLFTDSAKDVEIFLLNEGVRFSVEDVEQAEGALECIVLPVPRRFLGPAEHAIDARLSVFHTDAVRVAPRFRSSDPTLSAVERSGRAGAAALRSLLASPPDA
jgi:hypothetical protein